MGFVWEVAVVLVATWLGSMLRDWRLGKFWDEWRGDADGTRPVMMIRKLVAIPVWWKPGKTFFVRLDLHKFVNSDPQDCYHTHPGYAIRWVVGGGYVEEVFPPGPNGRRYWCWRPWMIGIVPPKLAHRVARVINGKWSYSFWLRGPVVANVKLVGDGWVRPGEAPERN